MQSDCFICTEQFKDYTSQNKYQLQIFECGLLEKLVTHTSLKLGYFFYVLYQG